MTRPVLKTAAMGLAAVVVFAAAYVAIQVRSQKLLQARHPLPPSAVQAATTPEAVAEGGHLVQVAACSLCHGRQMTGQMLGIAGSPVSAPNLTLVVRRRTDAELDRAIRAGLRPDGTSELGMPSHVYRAFTDAETAAIIGYLRSLKPQGRLAPRPAPGFIARAAIATGRLHMETRRVAQARSPLDLGPRFAAGRHLAAVDCGQCHGTDLAGGHGAPGPDILVHDDYSRAQFHALMRKGESTTGRDLELMSSTARTNFSHFTDPEIDALYDYLDARDLKLAGR